ncbi:YbaK/EbsC family protein [Pendulispora rubella]|uniref:YbaK/EbsC family protein n=1 Tax=Pendulispora rubella TaxID=2741070 RepID=A0ABZ2KXN8_9BACT
MKLPSHEFLDHQGIPYEPVTFPTSIEKGAASVARALGQPERRMVKTILFQTGSGSCVAVLLGGDQNAISGHLKKAVGSRDVRMAAPEIVLATTGYEIGSIPPFHWQPPGFATYVEASLLDEPVLGVGAGMWGHEILIQPTHLVQAARARIVNLTDRARPVVEE